MLVSITVVYIYVLHLLCLKIVALYPRRTFEFTSFIWLHSSKHEHSIPNQNEGFNYFDAYHGTSLSVTRVPNSMVKHRKVWMKHRSSLGHARPPGFAQTLSKEVPHLQGNTNAQCKHPYLTPLMTSHTLREESKHLEYHDIGHISKVNIQPSLHWMFTKHILLYEEEKEKTHFLF